MTRFEAWLWPASNVAASVAVLGVTLADAGSPVRPVIVLFFLLVCPGMALVRLLAIGDFVSRITLAMATSVALAGLASSVRLQAGTGANGTRVALAGLVGITLGATLVEVIQSTRPGRGPRRVGGGSYERRQTEHSSEAGSA